MSGEAGIEWDCRTERSWSRRREDERRKDHYDLLMNAFVSERKKRERERNPGETDSRSPPAAVSLYQAGKRRASLKRERHPVTVESRHENERKQGINRSEFCFLTDDQVSDPLAC